MVGEPVTWMVVVSNPRSRKNVKNPRLADELAELLGEEGRVEAPNSVEEMQAVAERCCVENVEVVAINGGDGTVGIVLTALLTAYGDQQLPAILLLRGGTMNTAAKNMGVFGRPAQILARVMAAHRSGRPLHTRSRWMIQVNDRVGFWFGLGVVSNYLKPYYEGSPPTPFKALWVFVRAAFSAVVGGEYAKAITAPVSCTVFVDGHRLNTQKWLAFGVGTLVDVGWGFRAFYRLRDGAGRAHVLGWEGSSFQMARTLPRVFFGKPANRAFVYDSAANVVHIQSTETLSYMMDGDLLYSEEDLRIRVTRAIQWIAVP
jgi:diacylglycerol kinase (ATP)